MTLDNLSVPRTEGEAHLWPGDDADPLVSGGCRRGHTSMGSALERHTAGRDLPAVQETARELVAASVSANTRRAYEGAFLRLRDWLAGRPLDDATLAEYLAARFEAGHSPAVASQVVAAVRFSLPRERVTDGQPTSAGLDRRVARRAATPPQAPGGPKAVPKTLRTGRAGGVSGGPATSTRVGNLLLDG